MKQENKIEGWIEVISPTELNDGEKVGGRYACPKCGRTPSFLFIEDYKYCPYCGSKVNGIDINLGIQDWRERFDEYYKQRIKA